MKLHAVAATPRQPIVAEVVREVMKVPQHEVAVAVGHLRHPEVDLVLGGVRLHHLQEAEVAHLLIVQSVHQQLVGHRHLPEA